MSSVKISNLNFPLKTTRASRRRLQSNIESNESIGINLENLSKIDLSAIATEEDQHILAM